MTDDLAGGFQSVDAASDFEVFSSCLTLVDSLPFFAACKRESYDLLRATPGRRILDVGCGLGDDAASLARLVAPGGSVVAIDGSRTMITAACERHADIVGLSFDVATTGLDRIFQKIEADANGRRQKYVLLRGEQHSSFAEVSRMALLQRQWLIRHCADRARTTTGIEASALVLGKTIKNCSIGPQSGPA
jgi:SAM-dependent methyltransferase